LEPEDIHLEYELGLITEGIAHLPGASSRPLRAPPGT
jgi:hypothetical protein